MRTLSTLLLIVFSGMVHAQVQHPFLDTNNSYWLSSWDYDGVNNPIISFWTRSWDASTYSENDSVIYMENYIEEKGTGRVYQLFETDTILIYDFSVEVGDSIHYAQESVNCGYTDSLLLVVREFDSVEVLESQRMVVWLDIFQWSAVDSMWQGCEEMYWIEGVGKLNFPFDYRVGGLYFNISINCVTRDGQGIEVPGFITSECNSPIGLQETEQAEWRVYPNPTSGQIHVEGSSKCHVEILDLSGRKLMTRVVSQGSLNLGDLAKGVYIIRMDGRTERIVLQ